VEPHGSTPALSPDSNRSGTGFGPHGRSDSELAVVVAAAEKLQQGLGGNGGSPRSARQPPSTRSSRGGNHRQCSAHSASAPPGLEVVASLPHPARPHVDREGSSANRKRARLSRRGAPHPRGRRRGPQVSRTTDRRRLTCRSRWPGLGQRSKPMAPTSRSAWRRRLQHQRLMR